MNKHTQYTLPIPHVELELYILASVCFLNFRRDKMHWNVYIKFFKFFFKEIMWLLWLNPVIFKKKLYQNLLDENQNKTAIFSLLKALPIF